MNLQSLLDQFVGSGTRTAPHNDHQTTQGALGNLASKIPGGLAGGAAAGGIMALLVGNKSARKFAGKAATVGGIALLGGLAYKGYQNWKQNTGVQNAPPATEADLSTPHQAYLPQAAAQGPPLELTLVKAMIAAAKADGHIDADEQTRIFDAVEQMNLPPDQKAVVFDCLRRPIPVAELAAEVHSVEHKSELYLAACLAIVPDHPGERAYLNDLATALQLPAGLPEHLERQANGGVAGAE